MRLSAVLFAVLPAFVAANNGVNDDAAAASVTPAADITRTTITATSIETARVTRTITLQRIHAVVSTINSTTLVHATGTISPPTTTLSSAPTTLPTPSKGPQNAGAALDAGKVVLAGFAGMAVAALM